MAIDEYRYSLKKQMDGLNLGKMRHSFHSFVYSMIFFRSAAFGGISFLLFKEGGLRVTRMLVTNSPRWGILNVWREALYSDGWGTTTLHYRGVKTLHYILINVFLIHFEVFILKLHEVSLKLVGIGSCVILKKLAIRISK